MTTFNLFILIVLVSLMVLQFMAAIESKAYLLSVMFGFEMVAFAYLAKVLM